MKRMFGLPLGHWADGIFYAAGLLIIDPFKFEEFLKRKHHYKCDGDTFESIYDFVLRKWGQGGADLLDRATHGVFLRKELEADQ